MNGQAMEQREAKHWYLCLFAGALMIAMGVWVLQTPLASYLALAFMFSVTFLISGILEIVHAFANKDTLRGGAWGWGLSGGIVNVLFGVVLVAYPGISIVTLPIYIGVVVLFRSVMVLSLAFSAADLAGKSSFWIRLLAILGVLFALVLLLNPVIAGMSAVVWTAFALISYGVAQIFLAIKLKKIKV